MPDVGSIRDEMLMLDYLQHGVYPPPHAPERLVGACLDACAAFNDDEPQRPITLPDGQQVPANVVVYVLGLDRTSFIGVEDEDDEFTDGED